ncbi:MAG: hypothetical protein CMJ80_09745 [Planctomycetaceae bacterium]|nr:hypothetical protein [Planctomycetaceae bacterium]
MTGNFPTIPKVEDLHTKNDIEPATAPSRPQEASIPLAPKSMETAPQKSGFRPQLSANLLSTKANFGASSQLAHEKQASLECRSLESEFFQE